MRRELVERAIAGDRDAYAELARTLIGRLYAIAFLILNNRRYAALQDFAPVFGYAPGAAVAGTELPDLDFVALAAGQGVRGVRVEHAAQLRDALAEALAAHDGPRLVEIEVA